MSFSGWFTPFAVEEFYFAAQGVFVTNADIAGLFGYSIDSASAAESDKAFA